MFSRITKNLLMAATVLGYASLASASPFEIKNPHTGFGNDDIFVNGLWRTIDIEIGGTAYTGFGAGLFKLESLDTANPLATWQPFVTFCIEIQADQFVSIPAIFTPQPLADAPRNATIAARMGRLWTARSSVVDADSAAAFQLALWAIEADDVADATLSNLLFTLNTSESALNTKIGDYLAIARDGSIDPLVLTALANVDSQDYVVVMDGGGGFGGGPEDVPAPASLVLFGSTLAALAVIRRRKS